MTKYIFDVDGTLTPSRQRINRLFGQWLEHWGTHNDFYLVTGSDRNKTIEQIGDPVYNTAKKVYQCSGNDIWIQDWNVKTNTITLPQGLLVELDKILNKSKFYVKSGQHIDYRPGLVNFSIIGRRCTFEERVMYQQWDEHKHEREKIARRLTRLFPEFNFQIAGETGIDITKIGMDKSQILVDFDDKEEIMFFGDMCHLGGNDYEIAQAIIKRGGVVHIVSGWEDTWNHLKQLG